MHLCDCSYLITFTYDDRCQLTSTIFWKKFGGNNIKHEYFTGFSSFSIWNLIKISKLILLWANTGMFTTTVTSTRRGVTLLLCKFGDDVIWNCLGWKSLDNSADKGEATTHSMYTRCRWPCHSVVHPDWYIKVGWCWASHLQVCLGVNVIGVIPFTHWLLHSRYKKNGKYTKSSTYNIIIS